MGALFSENLPCRSDLKLQVFPNPNRSLYLLLPFLSLGLSSDVLDPLRLLSYPASVDDDVVLYDLCSWQLFGRDSGGNGSVEPNFVDPTRKGQGGAELDNEGVGEPTSTVSLRLFRLFAFSSSTEFCLRNHFAIVVLAKALLSTDSRTVVLRLDNRLPGDVNMEGRRVCCNRN